MPLLPALARELRAHRVRQPTRASRSSTPTRSSSRPATASPRPSQRPPRRPDRRPAAGLNPEGAQPVGLHDLRHSAAGLAFESLALNEVSRLLRHANPRVTTTVYGGINDDAAAAIGNKLTNAGFGA